MINFTEKGSFNNTENYLNRLKTSKVFAILGKYGELGVVALSNATPRDSGQTAASWYYTLEQKSGYYSITWRNTNKEYGSPVAILIQYGHGTKNGGYVQGIDYINPAIQPIFEQIAADAWKEVTK